MKVQDSLRLLQIFYLSVVVVFQCIFLPAAWSRITNAQRLVTIAAASAPYILTYLTVVSTAHIITKDSHEKHVVQYPYDRVLFQPDQTCQTCGWLKPARSKHCRTCKYVFDGPSSREQCLFNSVCIAKQDHHCVWVMNCIGRGNYHYFLGMLSSLGIMLCYGGYLSYGLLQDILRQTYFDIPHGLTRNQWTQMPLSTRLDVWAGVFIEDMRVGATGLLCVFTAPLAWGMLLYHLYLIWAGMTTNESSKWDEWKEDIADGYVYKFHQPEDSKTSEDRSTEPSTVRWPVSSTQRLVNRANEASMQSVPKSQFSVPPWEQVHSLKDVINIYDLGFWDNLLDAFNTT